MRKKTISEVNQFNKNVRARRSRAKSETTGEWDTNPKKDFVRARPQYHITDEHGNTILRVPARPNDSFRTTLDRR